MKDDIKDFLTNEGVVWEEVDDLKAVASEVDVLYQTRQVFHCHVCSQVSC